ncbi:MAG: efflux RND transporter periplasmic adaptor subunit [bacterium]
MRLKRLSRYLGPAAGLIVIVWVIVWQAGGCGKRIEPGRAEKTAAVPEGRTLTVAATNVPVVYTAVGTIRSRTEVQLAARIVGRILTVTVRSGDRIKAGDTPVTLDDAELRTGVSQAKERVAGAQAGLAAASERAVQARSALDLATVEVDRTRKLAAQKMASQQALDAAEDAFRQAVSRMAQAEQGQIAAQADARAASEAQHQAETVAGYASVVCPMDGVVSERLADPGDLATPGNTLLRVFDPARLLLEAPIREGLVMRVKVGDKLPVTLDALGRKLEAEVREIVPSVDAGSRTFLAKLCLPQAEGVMPGMFGTVSLKLGERQALLVPESVLVRAGQLEYVNVVTGGRTTRMLVRSTPAAGGLTEILAGLQAGDVISFP